jgi:4-amino-4-deoxy-L-arabinose transferase-like glycosyltransferase
VVVAVGALLVAPAAWAAIQVWSAEEVVIPAAGPNIPAETEEDPDPRALAYLEAHRDGSRYLVATLSSSEAAPLIIASGQPAVAIGGYAGRDLILSPTRLADLVARHQLRFFLLPDQRPALPSTGQAVNALNLNWVWGHCTPVPAGSWRSPGGPAAHDELFDCWPAAASKRFGG